MSNDKDMRAEIARLQAENEKLRAAKAQGGKLALKVSDKGGVSVYGMGRFPVTLYREQWERLLAHGDAIQAFIAENADKLTSKGDKPKLAAGEVRAESGAVVGGENDTPVDAGGRPMPNGHDHTTDVTTVVANAAGVYA